MTLVAPKTSEFSAQRVAGQPGDRRGAKLPTAPTGPSGRRPSDANARVLSESVDAIADFVSNFEPGRYSGEDAASLVAMFTRAERLGAAGKTLAAARAAAANCHQINGQRSAAHWLAGVTGESVGHAVEVLDLGEALEAHPGVSDAYRTGRLPPPGSRRWPVPWRSTRPVRSNCSRWPKETPSGACGTVA